MLRTIELTPTDGRKSFYGKAKVCITDAGTNILYSYGVRIMSIYADGEMVRHWDDWTTTTGRHIKAFCGLDKKQFMQLELRS